MAKQGESLSGGVDTGELAATLGKIAEQSQRLIADFMHRQARGERAGNWDPLNISGAFLEMTRRMMADPAKLAQAQADLWRSYFDLWQATADRMMGKPAKPVAEPVKGDRRFRHPDWEENPIFDYIKQSYLLTSNWIVNTVRQVDGLDDETAKRIDFYTRQFVDAMAPSNFALTNPEVVRATVESGGQNLIRGLGNLLSDLERGKGRLHIRMTDEAAFEVGGNIAVTPGKVVFQNDLIQLLQFEPATEKVRKRPLLMVPPWINKYYVLDLRPENSFIKWAVEQGHTVFVVSWVNPDSALARKTFDDYMLEGPIAALDAIRDATGEDSANIVGYCIGGTLVACTLAYLATKRGKSRVASATFLATLVDFAEPGELGVFIDEEQLMELERRMNEKGYLEGADMATTFNMLRANDLIWSFVVNNYLLGKDPFPFDLLYWNSDSTRMPAAMHSFYLRRMYQENKLVEPGGLSLAGVPIDLRRNKLPTYILAARDDHIAPWRSCYAGTRIYTGPTRFVLSASGHIAGVVNPPAAKKYAYWTNDAHPADPAQWFAGAAEHPGSWWTDWDAWVAAHGDGEVPARRPGDGKLEVIEAAPGSYARVRASE
jgi:polyhydroxyalkanoate synthase